jgi:hypothetical protein
MIIQLKVEIFTYVMCVRVRLICHFTTKLSRYRVRSEGNSSDEANVRPFIRNSVLLWQLQRGG